jgi:hypothetical protein
MKKMNLFLTALVLSFVFFSCQKENIEPTSMSTSDARVKAGLPNPSKMAVPDTNSARKVFYEVNINIQIEQPLCNIYWVEMTDASGKNVAPKQVYIPGTRSYYFDEQIRYRSGIRIARLVLSPRANFICETELFTQPAIRMIEFKDMEKFTFELFPQHKPAKITD